MTKTQNFNLLKPEPADPLRVEDFNENADIIDGVLNTLSTAVPRIVTGTYTGDRAVSRTISLGFTPKAMYLCAENGRTCLVSGNTTYLWGGLALAGCPLTMSGGNALEIVEGGFKVTYDDYSYNNVGLATNVSAAKYYYIAINC